MPRVVWRLPPVGLACSAGHFLAALLLSVGAAFFLAPLFEGFAVCVAGLLVAAAVVGVGVVAWRCRR